MTLTETRGERRGEKEGGAVCPASHQLMYIMVLDYTVISTIIVATGAYDRHNLLNEHENVMTGFMEPHTSVPTPLIILPRVFFRSSEISLMAKSV